MNPIVGELNKCKGSNMVFVAILTTEIYFWNLSSTMPGLERSFSSAFRGSLYFRKSFRLEKIDRRILCRCHIVCCFFMCILFALQPSTVALTSPFHFFLIYIYFLPYYSCCRTIIEEVSLPIERKSILPAAAGGIAGGKQPYTVEAIMHLTHTENNFHI